MSRTRQKESYKWIGVKVGDYIQVPVSAEECLAQRQNDPVVNFIITTKRLGQFFH